MSPVAVQDTPIPPDLDPRFSQVKKDLVKKENCAAVKASWVRLLKALEVEVGIISKEGPSYVPSVNWQDIADNNYQLPDVTSRLFKERGGIMIKGLIDTKQIDTWFYELSVLSKENAETSGFTFPNPASWYNLFWTKPQMEARFHPNMRKLVNIMSNQFYVEDKANSLIDLDTQIVYGDRIRIREPGTTATLDLHLDSGSSERWEDEKFRSVYHDIFEGNWENWDPFKLDERQFAREDLYRHLKDPRPTICSSFRTLQGWLALSDNKSGEGTLKLLPNLKLAMTYVLLRPLFWRDPISGNPEDYEIDLETPKFPGALPSTGQLFIPDEFYPHLKQLQSVVSIPNVNKGDFVYWHADLCHEVDKEHNGNGNSSVLYYGVTPLTVNNIPTLLDTKNAFLGNRSPEDYASQIPAGVVENQGADQRNIKDDDSLRSMGLKEFEITNNLPSMQRRVRQLANQSLRDGKFDLDKILDNLK